MFSWVVALTYNKNMVSCNKNMVYLQQKYGLLATKIWLITFKKFTCNKNMVEMRAKQC